MDVVIVYPQDVADTDDINRLSDFPEAYFQVLLEAVTNGKRDVLFGVHTPVIHIIAAPNVTIRIPAQYYAADGRVRLLPQTDIAFAHPNPGTNHDFAVYLTVIQEDQSENRNNVDLVTFVQTPTARITHKTLLEDAIILDAASPGPAPTPPTGVIGPGQNRLGYVLLASFTWDGVAGTFPIAQNLLPVVNIGSAGVSPHGGSHVTTDPIPYPSVTERGMMPPASLPYLKNSLSRVGLAAGAPLIIVPDGSNGPAGDTNYTDPFVPSAAKGVLLDVDVGPSISKAGSKINVVYGTPSGGLPGAGSAAARASHQHLIFPLSIPKYYNLVSTSLVGPIAMSQVPTSPQTIVIDITRPFGLAILQVEMICNGPNSGPDDQIVIMELRDTPGTAKRYAMVRASGSGDECLGVTTVFMYVNAVGSIQVVGTQNINSSTKFRLSLIGWFGQG